MTANEQIIVMLITTVVLLGIRALMIQAEKNRDAQDEFNKYNDEQ